ncbi:uncharacterized protein [Eurosta solidaginis]|uniref:uncharacterized protein isoform X2 n=1 Tax=Eurosta solidaginis TaxID=178769 RepID=UPI0035310090
MLDKEGNSKNGISVGAEIHDTASTTAASTDAETLVVATLVADNDYRDTSSDHEFENGNVTDNSNSAETARTSCINHLLSIVRLCDGESTNPQALKKSTDLNQRRSPTKYTSNTASETNTSRLRSVSSESLETTTAIETVRAANSLINDADSDECSYNTSTNNNSNEIINPTQRVNGPTISVKCFSPVCRQSQTENEISHSSPASLTFDDHNDAETEQRNQLQGQNEDSEIQHTSNDRTISFPISSDMAPIARGRGCGNAPSLIPVEIIDLSSMPSEMCRGESPANSSVTNKSTARPTARNMTEGGRRAICMRHIRRAPKEPEEYLDALFPHIREAHHRIRQALLHSPLIDVKDNALLMHKMLEVIQLYTRGCKHEFERVGNSVILCRRLKRNIIRLLDLFNEICCASQNPFYLYHISQLIALYNSLEIKLSFNMTRLQKCALIHRLAHVINKHLIVSNESLAKENILRMFLHMPDMYSARFILEPLFNTFLPEILTSSKLSDQKELSDKTFVQYIIILHQWKEMLRDQFEQVELINKAQHFMCPTKTLHSNSIYANHLPIIHTRKNAAKDILNNLKFFQDLKNAAIFDDSMQDVDDDIVVVIDEDSDTPVWDFGATYTAEGKHIRHKKIQSRRMSSGPVECVDLTHEEDYNQQSKDDNVENHLTWLTTLKEKAFDSVVVDESENVICLDSDSDGELFTASIIDPTESYQDCDAFDTDYTSLDSSSTDDKSASDDETLPKSRITSDGLRTYLAPRSENQTCSNNERRMKFTRRPSYLGSPYVRTRDADGGESDSAKVVTKTSATSNVNDDSDTPWPLLLNTFSVREKKSKHFSKASGFCIDMEAERYEREDMNEMPEQNNENVDEEGEIDDEEYHSLPSTASSSRTNMGSVIFSQALPEINRKSSRKDDNVYRGQQQASDKLVNIDYNDKGRVKFENKRFNDDITMPLRINVENKTSKPLKKQVKFNDQPIGPTRRLSMNDVTKLPIKPAIQLNKQQHCFNQHCNTQHCYNQHLELPSSPRTLLTSPTSSTSSTTASLKQMAQKEHINAITTLFSGYKITKPPTPLVNKIDIPQLNAPTTAAIRPKAAHNSRKFMNAPPPLLPPLDTWRHVTNSPQSVCSLRSPPPRQHTSSPESMRSESPVYIPAELAEDPKLRKKCQVLMEENEHVIEYQRKEAAFINELLEKQREMQRQRALKRQEFQNLAKQKLMEDKRLMAEITEVKRQRDEMSKQIVGVEELESQKPQAGQQQQPQSSPLLKRKRMLVKERKVQHNTKTKRKSNTRIKANDEQTGEAINNTNENALEKNEKKNATVRVKAKDINTVTDNATVRSVTAVDENLITAEKDQDNKLPTRILRRRMSVAIVSKEAVERKVRSSPRRREANLENSENKKLNATNTSNKTVNLNQLSTSTIAETNAVTSTKVTIEAASEKGISEKTKLSTPTIVAGRILRKRGTRSMTPTSSTAEQLLPLNQDASFTCASPKSSRIGVKHRPSAASTPNKSATTSTTNRKRIDVRSSMRDPCSNTEFPSSATSWLLNVSPHTLTKTVRVRLKRLQDSNMKNSALNNSNEKVTKDISSRLRSASAIPFMLSEQENHELRPLDVTAPQPMLKPTQSNKSDIRESFELLKKHLEAQLLEMDKKYDGNVKEVIKKVQENTKSMEMHGNKLGEATALSTVELRTKKGLRRRAARKQASPCKNIKISENMNIFEKVLENIGNYINDDTNKASNANSKNAESEEAHFENAMKLDNIQKQITAHITNIQRIDNLNTENTNVEKRIESTAMTESEACEGPQQRMPVASLKIKKSAAVSSVRKDFNFNIDSSNIIGEKLRSRTKHDAVVTQVVDVTPRRFDGILSTTSVAAAAAVVVPTTALTEVVNSELVIENSTANEVTVNICSLSTIPMDTLSTELCTKDNMNTPPLTKPNNLDNITEQNTQIEISNEMRAAAASLTMMANKFTKVNTAPENNATNELQNQNNGGGDALQPVEENTISNKILPNGTVSSNITNVVKSPLVINITNDVESRAITSPPPVPAIGGDAVYQPQYEPISPPIATEDGPSCCSSAIEDYNSESMSQLENLKKLPNLLKPVHHVVKDSILTLLNFDFTPTLPTYLLSGESRDVPTPVPTPLPSIIGSLPAEAEQHQHELRKVPPTLKATPTPTDSLNTKHPLTAIADTSETTLCSEESNESKTKITIAKESEKADAMIAPVLAQAEPAEYHHQYQSITPPATQQHFEEAINLTMQAIVSRLYGINLLTFVLTIFVTSFTINAYSINVCEGVANNIFITDIRNCSSYFICVNGQPIAQECRDGLYFDASTQSCVVSNSVCLSCNSNQLTSTALAKTCNKYVLCFAGTPVQQQCADNLQFNPNLRACDLPKNVDCVSNYCSIYQNPNEIVYVASQSSCAKYFICMNGQPQNQTCISGLHFNPACKYCDLAANAKCTITGSKTRTTYQTAAMLAPHLVDITCPAEGIHFISHKNPHQYYMCVKGKGALMTCAASLYFDKDEGACRRQEDIMKNR